MMKKQKGFKTSPYFWGLILVPVALGLYDFVFHLKFRLHPELCPEASEWHLRSWLAAGGAALVFAAVIAWVDRYEREPWKWLLLALIWGAVVAPAINHQLQNVSRQTLKQDIDRYQKLHSSISTHRRECKECREKQENLSVLRVLRGEIRSLEEDCVTPEDEQNVSITLEQLELVFKVVWRYRVGPFVEELCKGLFVLLIFLGVPHEFDDWLDGIVYGAMVGVGFAMVEQVYYLQDSYLLRYLHGQVTKAEVIESAASKAFWGEFYERILLTGLWSHPMLTAFTGFGLGWARETKSRWQRWTAPLLGFGLAVFVHTNWNSWASYIKRASSFEQAALLLIGPFAILMVGLVLFALYRERKVLEHLAEVSTEFASKDVMRSSRARWRAQWKAWRRGGFRLWQKVYHLQRTLMEWAFLRWHMREGHVIDKEGAAAVWDEYRSKVKDLVEQIAER